VKKINTFLCGAAFLGAFAHKAAKSACYLRHIGLCALYDSRKNKRIIPEFDIG
jgi:hypothetical protein